MKSRIITLLDLETTGLDPTRHEIIEIGAVLLDQPHLNIVGAFEAKIKPTRMELADPEALQVNGYNAEEWAGARPAKEALEEFARRTEHSILCGQNVSYDFAFLRKAYADHNVPFTYHHHVLDVMSMAYIHWYNHPTLKRYGLSEMATTFGIDRGRAHRAMDDVKTTLEVLKLLFKDVVRQEKLL